MSRDPELAQALLQLLMTLEQIGEAHPELYDTDVREQMWQIIHDGFLHPTTAFKFPESFGLFSPEGNEEVRQALSTYLRVAAPAALNMESGARWAAFQDSGVKTPAGNAFEEFFGWV